VLVGRGVLVGNRPHGELGEFAAIERIRASLAAHVRSRSPGEGEVWIGDDAAVLVTRGGQLLLSTDLTVAGVHLDLGLAGVDDLGWRALVTAVSDIAAMGGRPGEATVAVAGPPATNLDLLYDGIGAAAEEHMCAVVGGDLSTAAQLVVCVSVTGFVDGSPHAVLRSGARSGDRVYVTGPLGAASAGLRSLRAVAMGSGARAPQGGVGSGRAPETMDANLVTSHLRPRARIAEGEAARRAGVTAMIDVSDGLAADLTHIAETSGVGFSLDHVPVADGADLDDALGGGEDYELVMTVADDDALLEEFDSADLRRPLLIGSCSDDPGLRTFRGQRLPALGFEHPWT
jgi:thiamine-monophosphate kinase